MKSVIGNIALLVLLPVVGLVAGLAASRIPSAALDRRFALKSALKATAEKYEYFEHANQPPPEMNSQNILPLLGKFVRAEDRAWAATGKYAELEELSRYGFRSSDKSRLEECLSAVRNDIPRGEHIVAPDEVVSGTFKYYNKSIPAAVLKDTARSQLLLSFNKQAYVLLVDQHYEPFFFYMPSYWPDFYVRYDFIAVLSPGMWDYLIHYPEEFRKFPDPIAEELLGSSKVFSERIDFAAKAHKLFPPGKDEGVEFLTWLNDMKSKYGRSEVEW